MLSTSIELLRLVVPENYGAMTNKVKQLSEKSVLDRVKQFANDNQVNVYRHLVYPVRIKTENKYDYSGWGDSELFKRPEKSDILIYNLEIWYERQLEFSQPEYSNTDGPL